MKTRTALERWPGKPYNQPGPTLRGASRPAQNLPPAGAAAPIERARPS